MTYPHGPIIKVELTHEDGTVRTLMAEEAKRWGDYVATQSFYMANHGMPCPAFAWKDTKPA